ncbi:MULTISPECIES: spore cortex biosynthesis protein YabQ [unclassified Paenibacillus]|uniref:spore cortex biosynthesis protein YabQ n=1 Tax=unclassified Paenibacillus TaxID=185978 RepID=UPI0009551D8D|nr:MULTISPECIES: spore cortex biosynthesis protein YabQ [unclassified Paenibacillus]SIR66796.1 spore cortex biosynthesis protein YabQ [Paenibacillus sp. RU4X]SIR74658.1 spore cortex biosynthesis protein YabQ [Paenibacillus sp. RU4T]
MTLDTQGWTLAMMMATGLLMGGVFDGYRVVSHELRFPRWILPALDIGYWLAAALAAFRILYASNNGEVRAYVYLGILIGICFYFLALSGTVIALVRWLIRATRAVIRFLLRCMDVLLIRPVIGIYRILRVLAGFLAVFSIFAGKTVLQLLRPLAKLVLWMIRPLTRPILTWLQGMMIRWKVQETARRVSNGFIQAWKRLFRK